MARLFFQIRIKLCQFTGIFKFNQSHTYVIVITKITIRIPQSWEYGMSKCVKCNKKLSILYDFLGILFETPKRDRFTTPRRIPSRNACQLNTVLLGIQAGCVSESRFLLCMILTGINASLSYECWSHTLSHSCCGSTAASQLAHYGLDRAQNHH